jgi:hypothetical protein
VRGVADAGKRAESQIVKDEGAEAAEHFAVDLKICGRLLQIHEGNKDAGEAKDGAGSAGSGGPRMPVDAGDAAEDTAGEISEKVGEAAEEALGGAAKIPKAPHVEAQMNEAKVNKHAGDQPPPLTAERERPKIRAELDRLLRSGGHSGNSAKHHDDEYQDAPSDKSDGDGKCSRRDRFSA